MIRRSHKKSKQGCAECKHSHKKCDESRPVCVNCTTAKKQCSYIRNASSPSPNDTNFVLSTRPDNLAGSRSPHLSIESHTTHTTNSSSRPLTPTPHPEPSEPYVNLLHLKLFQNLSAKSFSTLTDDDLSLDQDEWSATILKYTFSYPYLMYEALAFSALHLGIMNPSKSDIYITESTTLQAKALSLFNASTTSFNQDNLIPAFLFSGVLGIHCFCDTFLTPSPDLNTFLDRLVQSIRLLRGIGTLVGDSWQTIRNSDIKPLLQADDSGGPAENRDDEVTHAFENLRATFSQSHTLSAFESKVYCEAITTLIWVYNSNSTSTGPPNARLVCVWPVRISVEYTQLLDERKPEALVVLAHFSILLHTRRAFWAVGDAGSFLLTAIEEFLGEGWAEWLVVPKRMLHPLESGLQI